MPTPNGEKIVLRLLDKSRQPLDLQSLGLEGSHYDMFRQAIRRPHGMILVTGPTGSGKSTTLYAALKDIMSPRINISTVEDPIEYQIEGINQTQMHAAIGYTFANAVRTFLRQDPDVIMIGEIRDPETAKYAIQAAQTGHLVLSTLHTNDAPGAIVRLLEMGMEPYLVASTVHLIIAQRLVRRICASCKVTIKAAEDERRYCINNGIELDLTAKGKGCDECFGSGCRGRTGVFEIMPVSAEIQQIVIEKASTQKIRDLALEQGMLTLKQAALALIKREITSIGEVRAIVG
jgi:type II secretory ATPase GspE/PulE/Tfp pilus assembly ATPase PilB-like protein